MLTLQDLKWIVKKPEKAGKPPTARCLLEHGKCVVSMENGREIQLLVYQEGYVRLFLEGGGGSFGKEQGNMP